MQKMHSKLNKMNDLGEQISLQLNNSPMLTQSLNNKMDTLENKWNRLLYDMEYLSKKCNEQHIVLQQSEATQLLQQKQDSQVENVEQEQFNYYINQLYKVFNNISELINSNIINTDDSMINFEEKHDVVKVCS
jgi:hypothetical protein